MIQPEVVLWAAATTGFAWLGWEGLPRLAWHLARKKIKENDPNIPDELLDRVGRMEVVTDAEMERLKRAIRGE